MHLVYSINQSGVKGNGSDRRSETEPLSCLYEFQVKKWFDMVKKAECYFVIFLTWNDHRGAGRIDVLVWDCKKVDCQETKD